MHSWIPSLRRRPISVNSSLHDRLIRHGAVTYKPELEKPLGVHVFWDARIYCTSTHRLLHAALIIILVTEYCTSIIWVFGVIYIYIIYITRCVILHEVFFCFFTEREMNCSAFTSAVQIPIIQGPGNIRERFHVIVWPEGLIIFLLILTWPSDQGWDVTVARLNSPVSGHLHYSALFLWP